MKGEVPQRLFWPGQAERLSPAWSLTKNHKTAECSVWSHQFGFELRLNIASELVQSQVCRTGDKLTELQAEWRAALEAKGWSG